MARLLFIAPVLGLIALPVYSYITFSSPPPMPDLDLNAWWGPSELKDTQDTSIVPFEVSFDIDMIRNLSDRLKRCQDFTPPLEDSNFEYGFNTDQLSTWCNYWAEEYPFSQREKFFNQHPQFKIFIQGLWMHFIWVKPEVPPGVEVIPVLLLHGWPGSVREFYEVIPKLTAVSEDRDFALELIIPSLPGYGFSDGAVRPGLGTAEVAVLFRNLMQAIGHKNYVVQGGDWGSMIASNIATRFHEEVIGYHTNMPFVLSATAFINEVIGYVYPPLVVEPDQIDNDLELADRIDLLTAKYKTLLEESGYLHEQATKPDTVGIALTDSPVGLLAYILEKFSSATNLENRQKPDGGLSIKWTKEKLIDNLMMYWTPKCITTAIRLYAETFNMKQMNLKLSDIPTSVPTWVVQAKHEIIVQPEYVFKYKYQNLVNVTALEDGGHFLAFEMPEVFSEDVILAVAAFRKLREPKNVKTDF